MNLFNISPITWDEKRVIDNSRDFQDRTSGTILIDSDDLRELLTTYKNNWLSLKEDNSPAVKALVSTIDDRIEWANNQIQLLEGH